MQTSIGGRARQFTGQRLAHHCPQPVLRPLAKGCRSAAVASPAETQPEDKWLARTLKEVPTPAGLATLRQQSTAALKTLRMPSTRNEEYRFTDIAPLLRTHVQPAPAGAAVPSDLVPSHAFPGAAAVAVLVDGVLRPELSTGLGAAGGLPAGAYLGPLAGAPAQAAAKLGSLSSARGGPFAVLNGALAPDALVLALAPGVALAGPVYVLHVASGASQPDSALASCPRLLVHCGAGAEGELVEEFVGLSGAAAAGAEAAEVGGRSLTAAVAEVFLGESARFKHAYVQREAEGCFHFRSTLVGQEAHSGYELAEASVGGGLTRHDLIVQQLGRETHTEMGHFLLCGPGQLHDLHSRLQLDHPAGTANQLHKCIVSAASGKGVFDGNVQVNRNAQKSDAGQLSRNLLLAPLATVHVKPNLQIVADDVKCSHGCAVSDLRDDELFYFRARGISAEAARQALVLSFGASIVQRIRVPDLEKRVQADVGRLLKNTKIFAVSD